MRETFKEYHKFTVSEFNKLWEDCLFVFDTNTLLNFYRYSRETVDEYFKVLDNLNKKNQIWIPYQVGLEFYENRINVISEYEKSYDEILMLLDKVKKETESKYKDHPFLDLNDVRESLAKGLQSVEGKIKQAQSKHPKWLEKDEVLDKLNELFKGNVGNSYDEKKLCEIKENGRVRYEKKIPPGFKDDKKSDDKKYGDLILWHQMIDKAKHSKKPIILISGDVKEDWWLEKEGKKIMPLPQLKKEMLKEAGVDFHIYTADAFLELNTKSDPGAPKIDGSAIKEVRKIRELEEKRMLDRKRRREMMFRDKEIIFNVPRISRESLQIFELLENLISEIDGIEIDQHDKEEIDVLFRRLTIIRNVVVHGEIDKLSLVRFNRYSKELVGYIGRLIETSDINPHSLIKTKEMVERLQRLIRINQSLWGYV